MKLLLICKGSSILGLGHLLRSRTFAKEAKQFYDFKIVPVIESGLESIFSNLSADCHFVKYDIEIIPIINEYKPDIVVFDMTTINHDVFIDIKKNHKALFVSISPIFDHAEQIDVLFSRTKNFTPINGVKIFGGLEYSIFNEYCTKIDDETFYRNLSNAECPIAICMGGSDSANKTLTVLQNLINIKKNCTFWVLLGEGYSHSYNQLVDISKRNKSHEVILAKTNRSMWKILSNCVIAILAGGLTTIEAVYAGLPTINLFEKEDHLDAMANELFEKKVCLNGGFFNTESLKNLSDTVTSLLNKKSKLIEMRENTYGLINKQGSKKIIEKIEYICKL